jgi:hypothetical protein
VEQLRRYVDDQAHLENRRILDLIRAIETHALELKDTQPQASTFGTFEGMSPDFELPMCRVLYKPARNPVLALSAVEEGSADLDLSALFAQTAVDEKRLHSNISTLLRQRDQVTLGEVAAAFPPQQGLAEVVTYLRIAGEQGAAVDESVRETLILPAAEERGPRRITLPRVIFAP